MGREDRIWDGRKGYGTYGEDRGLEERIWNGRREYGTVKGYWTGERIWDERENMGREERIWDGRKEMGRERGYGTGGKDVGREREDVGREDFFSSDSGELFSSPLTLFELGAGTRHSWCF